MKCALAMTTVCIIRRLHDKQVYAGSPTATPSSACPSPLGRRREAVSLDHQHVRLLKGLARDYALPCRRRHDQRVHGHKVVQVHLRAAQLPL